MKQTRKYLAGLKGLMVLAAGALLAVAPSQAADYSAWTGSRRSTS